MASDLRPRRRQQRDGVLLPRRNIDGNADIIHAAAGPAVYFGDGLGGFVPGDTGLPQSSSGLSGISPGDVDNDGGCDVAFANPDGGVEVWSFDDASGVWQSVSGTLPSSGDFRGTQLCDMNADGFVDVCALGGGHTKVWLGDGQGNWTEAADITTADGTYAAFRTGADFDHNGFPDLAFVTREGSWPNDYNRAHAFKESSPYDSLTIFPVFPRGGEKFANGSVQFIDWWSAAMYMTVAQDPVRDVKLELSTTGPSGPWQDIYVGLLNNGRFQWTTPESVNSSDCYIRYMVVDIFHIPPDSAIAITPRAFTIGDTVPGVAESHQPQTSNRKLGAAVVKGVLYLNEEGHDPESSADFGHVPVPHAALLDAAGRKVMDLHAGPNDVSRLAPGVYFVREAQAQAQAIRRVVVTR